MAYQARTSKTHPIEVGWLEEGRLGLTFAPGKRASSLSGPPWERDLRADLGRLVEHHGARLLVSLVEDHELVSLHIPDLVAACQQAALEVIRFPIVDGSVPHDLGAVQQLVETITLRVRGGSTVVVHCRGGLGRAGTIGGCSLAGLGKTPEQIFTMLFAARGKNCPENDAQRDFIRRFARARGAA